MLDPGNDLAPSTPSISDSTGSFFHDRSTTLGILMGVSFWAGSFRVSSQRENNIVSVSSAVTGGASANTRGGGRWWRLCKDDSTRPSSLGDFLEVE
uniref:Uncharacterized protein n=1 Tax=Nelumbo nucifera TaxID=4432 RepID=A0A822YFA7_NELNU|nr:TPA_asm: hypothetical protein HUJ06_031164 [Nelumbo nucifera]